MPTKRITKQITFMTMKKLERIALDVDRLKSGISSQVWIMTPSEVCLNRDVRWAQNGSDWNQMRQIQEFKQVQNLSYFGST